VARILIVEDDPWSRRLVADVLEMAGHLVFVAGNVAEGHAHLAEAPQLVLLDINIPGGGGEVLLREIRGVDELRRVPVVALTASAMTGDRERFMRLGFTSYMSKPIDVRTFNARIAELLR
jgi:DNA-binding response OmpR family regulator